MRRLGQFARYQLQEKTLKTWKRSRSICPGTVFTSCVSGGYVEVFIYPVNFSWRNEWKCNIPVNSWTNTHLGTKLWLELRSDSMKTTDTLNSWSKSRIFQHSFSMTGIAVNFFQWFTFTLIAMIFLFCSAAVLLQGEIIGSSQPNQLSISDYKILLSLNVGFLNQKDVRHWR